MTPSQTSAAEVNIENIRSIQGIEYGPSEPVQMSQSRIDLFAEATGDLQWIHIDPVRAADSVFGSTIAHGFLVLSLIATFNQQLVTISGAASRLNYGLNKVRFPSTAPVNSILRGYTTLSSAESVRAGTQLVFELKVVAEGVEKPVCVAEFISLVPGIHLSDEA
ncbi:MaoC family dehydratase [Citricoccus sp. NR2]|uniref:MaoC family dehydratase n=1 Tax=Citricoccus sp. NR2 TaxID=3004095 RepID=UPI0022DD9B60|nr:MaoC family dehydratase [Citricoccus sp. NR2]WBL19497.1 MaoC family dehydratase [Citricoccus sp. NR2]